MEYTLTDDQAETFNTLYERACSLYDGLLHLDGLIKPKIGFFGKRKLIKCIAIFEEALKIHPASWQSMFFIAKSYQSLGDVDIALSWFRKAYKFEPSNTSLAKEIGLCANRLGIHNLAIEYMKNTAKLNPDDYALHVNLGFSYLMSNKLELAKSCFTRSVLAEPDSTINKELVLLVDNVMSGKVERPKSENEILKIINKNI